MDTPGGLAVRGRFAPSPTGRMHAGNIFASLVAWIRVRREEGTMVLRIEDLDASRSRSEHAATMMRDFEALGLDWDEGPFYQHDQDHAYNHAYNTLRASNHIYPCFCTRADVASAAAPHAGTSITYAGTCRNLSIDEQEARRAELAREGRRPSWRLEVPSELIDFDDAFYGACSFDLATDCGDTILKRSDGGFSYQLAVVVDDAQQGITQVTRGSDLLPSTAVQIHLQRLLGLSQPHYGHIPLLVTADGRRLAKRDHDASLDSLLRVYGSPEGILGHIAYSCGLIPDNQPVSANELVKGADLSALEGCTSIVWKG